MMKYCLIALLLIIIPESTPVLCQDADIATEVEEILQGVGVIDEVILESVGAGRQRLSQTTAAVDSALDQFDRVVANDFSASALGAAANRLASALDANAAAMEQFESTTESLGLTAQFDRLAGLVDDENGIGQRLRTRLRGRYNDSQAYLTSSLKLHEYRLEGLELLREEFGRYIESVEERNLALSEQAARYREHSDVLRQIAVTAQILESTSRLRKLLKSSGVELTKGIDKQLERVEDSFGKAIRSMGEAYRDRSESVG